MREIHIEDAVNGYVDLVRHVFDHGRSVAPRGQTTVEIEDALVRIDNVFAALPLRVGRGVVPGIGAVEACQLLGGISTPELVVSVGPQFKNYAQDDGTFHGSYGIRTLNQYRHVVEKLKADTDTRQAVVTMWDPSLDNLPDKRDYPCTVMHQFRIRDGRLNMSVYMRSNDVWLGAAYDFFQFTRVQIAIASILGIEPGTYNHHVGSLHIYENNFAAAANLRKTDEIVAVPTIVGPDWDSIEMSARTILRSVTSTEEYMGLDSDQRWYSDAMRTAMKHHTEVTDNG